MTAHQRNVSAPIDPVKLDRLAEVAVAMSGNEKEFEEIAHAEHRITFVREDGEITGVKLSGSGGGIGMFHVLASSEGQLHSIVPLRGYMPSGPPPPEPIIQVFMVSDVEGLHGRKCPECRSYFRTDWVTEATQCPYCGHEDGSLAFTTENQQEFVKQYCKLFLRALEQGDEVIVDLNQIALSDNKPHWAYSEERQQRRFDCERCGTGVDVLGDYAACPGCGMCNHRTVIEEKLNDLEQQFQTADENLADRQEREIEWEKLLRCVSEFEAMAKDLRSRLLLLPATPRRKT